MSIKDVIYVSGGGEEDPTVIYFTPQPFYFTIASISARMRVWCKTRLPNEKLSGARKEGVCKVCRSYSTLVLLMIYTRVPVFVCLCARTYMCV